MGLDLTFGRSLKAFCSGFSNLKHLIYLNLENCQGLTELPKSIGGLKKLENLHLGFCSFTKLPGWLGGLKMLVVLDLGNCANLKCLPKSIGKLEKLVTLSLFQCFALNYLPLGFDSLKRLESLNLLGCGRFHNNPSFLRTSHHIFNRFSFELVSLRNLKIDSHNLLDSRMLSPVRSLVIHKSSDFIVRNLQSMEELEDLTLHTGDIKDFASDMKTFFNP